MKKLLAALMALAMLLTMAVTGVAENESEELFKEWNKEAPALKTLIEYVETVTDEASPDFIPLADRIAVFDMDGTLCAELNPTYLEYYMLAWRILKDPNYLPDAEMLEFGRMLRDHALDKSFPDHMDMLHATHAAKAYAGMTLTQFADFVTNCLVREADGFEGMTYANTFYLPMIEVVEYLQDNGFTVYVVSGSDRYLCRTYIEGVLDIPYSQIIGMDVKIEASNQDGKDGLDYVYSQDDTLVRTDVLKVKNLKMNKVSAIIEDIGRQPVLSFGNSSGDVSMHNYTIFNNPYKSAAFMLIADNEELDYGNAEKVQPLKEKWIESGYNVISMRDDFRTIYGDDVKKTGTFHWLEDLAEERVPVDDAPKMIDLTPETEGEPAQESAAEPAAEQAEETADTTRTIQYVMYVGTNDQDTNKPVYTQAESLEKLKDVLIRHFGGYTIQEANGGWIDSGTEYQEYTLVVYLSDTTLEAVHSAADELISLFHQSSILIQQNPTTTEFYSPAK
ncbi:MAG: haloacid dehalogenase-like hydrolase [Clostridia bacterium]|nr:haloacid dehalogenase-like hydrolase [Clostridia bacterium]